MCNYYVCSRTDLINLLGLEIRAIYAMRGYIGMLF